MHYTKCSKVTNDCWASVVGDETMDYCQTLSQHQASIKVGQTVFAV